MGQGGESINHTHIPPRNGAYSWVACINGVNARLCDVRASYIQLTSTQINRHRIRIQSQNPKENKIEIVATNARG